jgi:lactoylglutathione lyase
LRATYVHTNIVARDWKRLVRFYVEVFGCTEKPPERDLSGDWLDRLTGLEQAGIRGVHLLLPGCGPDGPTLEVFQYDQTGHGRSKAINAEGFGHIAFAVDDVDRCLRLLLENGGSTVGETVRATVDGMGPIHLVYARDPEGNIVEIQKWE